MTNGLRPGNNPAQLRADVNKARRLQAIRELEALLRQAIDPGFTGSIGVELSAKEGRLGQIKVSLLRWPQE